MNNVRFWTEGVPVEHDALNQIRNIAALPIVAGPVAIMPDVHLGKGATVGSVIPTRGAIIPAAVGVDIGCGMCAVKTTLTAADLPDSLARLRSAIEFDHAHKGVRARLAFDFHRGELLLELAHILLHLLRLLHQFRDLRLHCPPFAIESA